MHDSPTERVAANVRAAAARKRATQTALAASLGISQQALSRRLLGHVEFRIDELHALATALDVPIDTLVCVDMEAAS
ncbi:helix-turn-helix transcriptional regulator [Nocardia puris]|uniref:helix-turn-helix domain-containing protein n=1 Tax=Nocardia puris TaxID=208602 RepID=UPI001894FA14|nr:helix-turn-helix transcriptional regulator [Nocardia puris]MBF6368369.1 helix-turn-helix transcriptional regulator [Nocardia puris]